MPTDQLSPKSKPLSNENVVLVQTATLCTFQIDLGTGMLWTVVTVVQHPWRLCNRISRKLQLPRASQCPPLLLWWNDVLIMELRAFPKPWIRSAGRGLESPNLPYINENNFLQPSLKKLHWLPNASPTSSMAMQQHQCGLCWFWYGTFGLRRPPCGEGTFVSVL